MRRLVCLLFVLLLTAGSACAQGRVFMAEDVPPFPEGTPLLEMYVCPLLGADAMILVQGEHAMMVDMGKAKDFETIQGVIDALGITHFDEAFHTHPHTDHLGSMKELAQHYAFDRFLTGFPENMTGEQTIQRSTANALRDMGMEILHMDDGDTFPLGDATLTVIRQTRIKGVNQQSMMLLVTFGDCRLLLGADVTGKAQDILAEDHDLQADILKYPHHGKTKLSAAFLADVNPAFVLITHGSVNSAESQKQLDKVGIPYTFATWGMIHLSCDGKEWHVAQDVTEVSEEYVRKFWEKKGK